MTRNHARHELPIHARNKNGFDDFCVYAGFGIRVGYARHKLLRHLGHRQRRRLKGRIVLALTANPHYRYEHITPGATITRTTARRLHLRHHKPFEIGTNTWYLIPTRHATIVLRTQHRLILEIGIANPTLTRTRHAQHRFLHSLT